MNNSNYKAKSQTNKNIAWYLPRPKPDHYKGGMPLHCEEWLIQLAKDILNRLQIDILNLFCGMNKYGFRIDVNKEVEPDLLSDANDFSNKINKKFDVILADPPYSDEESKKLYNAPKLNYKRWTGECDKVLKNNGLLIIYHKYIVPNPNPEKYKIIKRVFIGNRIWHLPRVAIYFQKNDITK
jgi:hypothetical protein